MAEPIIFKKKTTECCLVYNYKKSLLGEIRKRRINYYKQWVFQPIPIRAMGDLWYTKSFMEQVIEMQKTLRRRGFCVEQDMTDERDIVKSRLKLEADKVE